MKPITDLKKLALYALLAVLALAGALWAVYDAGHEHGQLEERATWEGMEESRRLQIEEAQATLEANHKAALATERNNQIINNLKVSKAHENEIALLSLERAADRAAFDRAGGLRIKAAAVCPAAGGAGTGTETASAGGRDEAGAGTVRLPLEVENDLWAIANDADEVSAQLRSCQQWIRRNGFYGPEPSGRGQLLDRMIAAPNQPAEEPTP